MSARVWAIIALLSLELGGCAAPETPGRETLSRPAIGFARDMPADLQRETVFAATTRAPGDPGRDVFTGFRAGRTHYVRHEVTVPSAPGQAELAVSATEAAADPMRQFAIASQVAIAGADAFAREVAAAAAGRRVVLFVHGYNNSYRDALYAMMHIRGRGRAAFEPVLFSFASQAAVTGYGYDKDSALAARRALAELIEQLAAAAPGRLDIAAHSMGTWLAAEALQQIALRRGKAGKPPVGGLLLASPDIDADLFDAMWPSIRPMAADAIAICHEGDRALRVSTLIGGGGMRVGSLPDCERAIADRYPGLKAVDAAGYSATQQDRFLHNPGTNQALVDRMIATAPR